MIQILSLLDESTCRNCGEPIVLYQGDLDRDPHWWHLPKPKVNGRPECPGIAEPVAAVSWETATHSGVCASCGMPSDWADSCSQGCESP